MRNLFLAAVAVAALAPVSAAAAQQIEGRVSKLESEMRAVQRKVFPDGASRLLQPDIAPATQGPELVTGVPASSPVADLTARVATLEQQIATLTGQIEQNQYRLRQLDEAFTAYRRDVDARVARLEQGGAPFMAPADAEPAVEEPAGTPPTAEDASTPVASVPATGDAGEDAYLRGFRFWEAKRYTEAERQLKEMVSKHPKHRRASYAQNLLGRTYLDQGKPSLASIAFYENYKKMPNGERAPQSLYYLAQALVTLKKPADACKVYDELSDVYAAKIDARMKADITKGRAAAKCAA